MNSFTITPRQLLVATLTLGSIALGSGQVQAQRLHVGVMRAEHVVIAQAIGVQPLDDVVLHRFRTIDRLKGAAADEFSIAVPKQVADTPTPQLDTRPVLLCLRRSDSGSIPARYLPLYKLTGYRGDRQIVGEDEAGKSLRALVEALVASETGIAPDKTADAVWKVLRDGEGPARLEASEALRSRPVVRDALTRLDRGSLVVMAAGGVEDSALLCSLAQLAVEADCKDVMNALCSAVPRCDDLAFARTVGRLAAFQGGDEPIELLVRQLQLTEGPPRDRVLLAVGATKSAKAFEILKQEIDEKGARKPVLEAMTAHGSKEALEIVKKHRSKTQDTKKGSDVR